MGLEQKEKPSLTPFFKSLEQEFGESDKKYSFCARIGGRKAALCFPSQAQAAEAEQCFADQRIPEVSEPDARLCFFSDDCSRYINQNSSTERRRYRDKDRWIIFAPNRWIIGADVPNHTFYYCLHDSEKRAPIPYWRVSALVSQWALTAGLLPIHGGAVGADGKGVLLIANGGGGKSTLAASCLLSGMDYVADDYVLVSAEGPLIAMPLFSTLKMNRDMKGELRLNLPVICEDPSKPGKQLLNASSFPICREMAVHAAIFLNRRDWERPEISPASGYPAVRFAQTAIRPEGAYDPLAAKTVVQRLSELPAYDMRLGGNLKQNADMLREWIERMK